MSALKSIEAHIGVEEGASRTYRQLAAWCDINSYPGCASHFIGESKEEMDHALEMQQYVCDRGMPVVITKQPDVSNKIESLQHVFESALKLEQSIFNRLAEISDEAAKGRDWDSVRFLQKYLEIGTNSVQELSIYVDQLRRLGDEACGLLVFDNMFKE